MSQQAEKLAKSARTALSEALNALQTSADVPDALMEVADPIANAMGILHRIERTQGQDMTGKELALKHVRASLDLLQSFEFSHEALDIVMEKVAGCLTAVHQLARMAAPSAPQAAPPPAAAPVTAQPAAPVAAQPAPSAAPAPAQTIKPTQTIPIGQPSPVAAQPATPRQPTPPPQAYVPLPIPPPPALADPAPGLHGIHGTQMMPQPAARVADPIQDSTFPLSRPAPSAPQLSVREVAAPVSQSAFQPAPAFQPPPSTATPAAASPIGITAPIHASLGATAPYNPQPASHAPAPPSASQVPSSSHAPAPPSQQSQRQPSNPGPVSQARPSQRGSKPGVEQQGNVVVELGAHSASNFYKGLGGNDVIEHGGLFVATYRIPKLGAVVMLRVLLPGDYEFTASGTVQWTREPSDGVDSYEPGFGTRFTQITPEGRQLVYRYTRNREPMFYDDL
ncbi:MAG: hypothetical protein U0414_07720 [Polyangiaceae bacterium]